MPTSYPRHSVTETPALAAALEPLRRRLGRDAPTLTELIVRGARATLSELEAVERARTRSLETFVERLGSGPAPDLDEVHAIRHSTRDPAARR